MTEIELLNLKGQIDSAKSSVSELKGQLTALLKQLKDDYKCNSVQEAEKKVDALQDEIETLQKQIDKGCKELEDKYNL